MTTRPAPPDDPKPFPWIPLLVLLGLTAFGVAVSLQSATPPPEEAASWWDSSWQWIEDKARATTEWVTGEAELREAAFEALRKKLGGLLAISALIYLTVYFFGAPVAEWARARLAERLKLGRTAQRDLAVAAFTVTCCAVASLVFFAPAYAHARACSIILLGGAAYPFLVKVLPGITREDAALRMAGARDMKAVLSVLAIVLLAFHLLDGGLGGMIDPTAGG